MPQPVSRLFPKLSVKSDDAQLTLTVNPIAIRFTANGDNLRPTIGAPKLLPIVFDHPIKLILRVNGSNTPVPLLSKHLQDALVSNASFLDITSVSPLEDHILEVKARKPPQVKQYLPHAVLDYITIDYRFSHLSSTFKDTAGGTLRLFLPLRRLLDQIVHRFLGQLIRQLPEAFGSWKETLANETGLARHAARHLSHTLSLSKDDALFQHRVRKQLLRIDARLRSAQDELVVDLGHHILPDEDSSDSQTSTVDISKLISFAVQTTYKENMRPKFGKRIARSQTSLELIDDPDPSTFSSQDPTTIPSLQDTFNDDEPLQIDSPIYPSSPVSSIIQIGDTPILENDSDQDVDLDLDAVDWHEDRNENLDSNIKIAGRGEGIGVDEWAELSFAQEEKEWTTVGLEMDAASPPRSEDAGLELLCNDEVTKGGAYEQGTQDDHSDIEMLDLEYA